MMARLRSKRLSTSESSRPLMFLDRLAGFRDQADAMLDKQPFGVESVLLLWKMPPLTRWRGQA